MRVRVREAAATAILEAAEEVAAQRGLEATSTAAIAERAGVAVGTLYNYFPDRDALLAALFKLRREELLPHIAAAAEHARALPFEARLRAYIAAVLAAFEDYRRFCKVAMSADHGAIKIRGRQSTVLESIVAALTEILRPASPDTAEEHARMMFGAMKAILHHRIERDLPFAPAAPLLVDTFLHGLGAR
jgi:AcrR family transcriptional regulator